jgi:hypothetical protein
MLFSKRGIAVLLGLLGCAAGLLNAEETQTNWLKTMTQNAVPQNAGDDKPATVAGTRGLNESSESVNTTARDDAAIDRLDKITVTPEAVNHFITEGKLQ